MKSNLSRGYAVKNKRKKGKKEKKKRVGWVRNQVWQERIWNKTGWNMAGGNGTGYEKIFSSNYSQTILEVWFQRILHYTDRFNLTRFCFASSTNVLLVFFFFSFFIFGIGGAWGSNHSYLLASCFQHWAAPNRSLSCRRSPMETNLIQPNL